MKSITQVVQNLLKPYIDVQGYYGKTELTTATDLNTLTTIGSYYKSATDFAVTNAPTGIAGDIQATFRLEVESLGGKSGTIIKQTLTATTGEVYSRIYSGVSWSAWQQEGVADETVLTVTLAANATSATFTGIPTSGDYLIDFYISDGSNYKEIDLSTAGTAVLTYDASASSRTVFCLIKGV